MFFGMAYAGSAAGGALSSMFWNPAAVGQFDGINSDSNYTLIMPDTEITATGGALFGSGDSRSSGDIGDTAILPASYFSYQLSDKAVLGLSVNAPFGLTTDGGFAWDGSALARESKIVTYNFAPTLAYRVSPGVIVAAGVQIEYIDAQLRQAAPPPVPGGAFAPTAAVKGDDWALGFTAGILLTPADGTTIGLGFRSKLDHNLEGTFHIAGVPVESAIKADISLPEMLTLSLRQTLAPAWTLLGTVEWTNWSRVPELKVDCVTAGPGCAVPGANLTTLPLGWEDGWFVSAGLEHQYSSVITLRGGLAWEKSPIQSAAGRTIRVPDADRIWASIGASYKHSEWTTIDVSYGHLFVEDSVTAQGPGGAFLRGNVETSADAISIGVRSKLDWLLSGK